MTKRTVNDILEDIYTSLKNDNEQLDTHIQALKALLQSQGAASVEVDTSKLVQPNRQGRKLMQSYFKQRGVNVTFAEAK